mgnify:CR=1 FL=1|jgi:hypothetical protein
MSLEIRVKVSVGVLSNLLRLCAGPDWPSILASHLIDFHCPRGLGVKKGRFNEFFTRF